MSRMVERSGRRTARPVPDEASLDGGLGTGRYLAVRARRA